MSKVKQGFPDNVALEFSFFPLEGELLPFPRVYVDIDLADLAVWFKIILKDNQQREGWDTESVTKLLGDVLGIDSWGRERDATLRAFELYGFHDIMRKKRKPKEKAKS